MGGSSGPAIMLKLTCGPGGTWTASVLSVTPPNQRPPGGPLHRTCPAWSRNPFPTGHGSWRGCIVCHDVNVLVIKTTPRPDAALVSTCALPDIKTKRRLASCSHTKSVEEDTCCGWFGSSANESTAVMPNSLIAGSGRAWLRRLANPYVSQPVNKRILTQLARAR